MEIEPNKYKTPKAQMVEEPDSASAAAQSIMAGGAEFTGKRSRR